MAVEFKNYYKILGLAKDASQEEIKRAYRKLARKHHPDLNKTAGSEAIFKDINEAHEVLGDPEKRKKYDQFGSNWQHAEEFRASQDWENGFRYQSSPSDQQESFFWSSEGGDYSDFFEALFGGGPFRSRGRPHAQQSPFGEHPQGADQEAILRISLPEAYCGVTKSIALHAQAASGPDCESPEKHYEVKIPAGILPGQKIRLHGQGGRGRSGGSGDLYLKVEIAPHPYYRLEGRDLITDMDITPWEAALGAKIDLPPLGNSVTLKVPPGSQSGQKLRLTGKGMPNAKGRPGDLYAVIQIKIPKPLTPQERELFETLGRASNFNPRQYH